MHFFSFQEYSTKFSCKYSGKTIKTFAFRVHAHAHGDVNAAYKIENHEWSQLALGDPQWPQAFYPTESLIEIKDGNSLVGMCTYHNDEDRYIYAGSTHKDEMCNVYLMYYADSTDDVMQVCDGNAFPQLENIIPPEAEVKPAPLPSFSQNGDSSKKDSMSHHDMEGSKIHQGYSDSSLNNNKDNNKQLQKSLIDLLSQGIAGNEDYYDDIESSRSKSRGKSKSVDDDLSANSNDDSQNVYDTKDLIDALNSDNSIDYQSLPDADQSLLLASTIDKLNGNSNNNNNNNNNKNNNLSKIKLQLKNIAKSLASKIAE